MQVGRLRLSRLWTSTLRPAVDLPSRAGDTSASLRLSSLGRPISSHPSTSRSYHAMNNAEFQLRGVGDPRLAVHATSRCPHGCGRSTAREFCGPIRSAPGCSAPPMPPACAGKIFGPADPHRRQVAQLAGRLPPNGAIRLERLRGFGAPLGMLATCGCARLEFADGQPRHSDRGHRSRSGAPCRWWNGCSAWSKASTRRSRRLRATACRRRQRCGAALFGFRDLSEAGLERARSDALTQGRVETPIGIGHMVLQRVGSGADIGLVA